MVASWGFRKMEFIPIGGNCVKAGGHEVQVVHNKYLSENQSEVTDVTLSYKTVICYMLSERSL